MSIAIFKLCVAQLEFFSMFRFQDLQVMVEDEQKARDEAREGQARAERNANQMSSELEDLRSQLEQVGGKTACEKCNFNDLG